MSNKLLVTVLGIIGIFIYPSFLHSQSVVYVCNETGTYYVAYNNVPTSVTNAEELLSKKAKKGCEEKGGKYCNYIFSTRLAGWYHLIVGTDGKEVFSAVGSSGTSALDANTKALALFKSNSQNKAVKLTHYSWRTTFTYKPWVDSTSAESDFNKGLTAMTNKSYATAKYWWISAAAKGNDKAMFNLGNWYYKGTPETKPAFDSAFFWYQKAANKGNGAAMYGLGMLYYNGEGTTTDITKAKEWIGKAAEKNIKEAKEALKKMDTDMRDQVLAEFNKAIQAYQAKQYKEALSLLTKVADMGLPEAMFNLGIMHYSGQGTVKNDTTAKQWYQKAADRGHPTAMYNLGYMYEKGIGTKSDKKQALEWYQKAKAKGYAKAAEGITRLTDDGEEW